MHLSSALPQFTYIMGKKEIMYLKKDPGLQKQKERKKERATVKLKTFHSTKQNVLCFHKSHGLDSVAYPWGPI